MIGELPLTELSSLVKYAEETEREKLTRSVYLEYFNAVLSTGNEPIGYEEYLGRLETNNVENKPLRNSDDILNDMLKIEEIYRQNMEG